ncbi:hypothetical protein ABBQ38_009870 [Trebouxia sp. C0009 RCD-2024]
MQHCISSAAARTPGTQQQLFARVSVRPWIGACSAAATSVFVSPIAALRLSPLCNGVDCNILLCFTSNPGLMLPAVAAVGVRCGGALAKLGKAPLAVLCILLSSCPRPLTSSPAFNPAPLQLEYSARHERKTQVQRYWAALCNQPGWILWSMKMHHTFLWLAPQRLPGIITHLGDCCYYRQAVLTPALAPLTAAHQPLCSKP